MAMKRTARHQQRGFTLAEILVTTAIFAVIMIAALSVYDQSNRVFKSGTESADMQQSTRIGFDKLVADLRMAGFDYNRGGSPTGNGQFPQMDEQIEYAGRNSIVFRGNFNYNTAAAAGNGLEAAYTPKDASGAAIFPFVTTSNDEIVAYVLRSADSTKNTAKISFYVDSTKPRSVYPGGSAETLITIGPSTCATCGVDTSNDNPPYTLYRVTLSDVVAGQPGTPVAENIRSLDFFYYTDTNGATLLKNNVSPVTDIGTTRDGGFATTPATTTLTVLDPATGAPVTTTVYTGAIGGDGKFDPAGGVTANFGDRQSRATIQSVRVNVIGMNANPEPSYTQPTETIARVKGYRQYPLAALIVPRNLGLTGFPEPTSTVPASPTIVGICTAHCAAPVICWSAPIGGGQVDQYRIEWDSSPTGSFPNFLIVADPTATTAILQDNGAMDPSITWYYRIFAQNENGSSPPPAFPSAASVKNSTKPMPPAAGTITTASTTNYAVTLNWTAPATNDPAKATSTCTGTGCSTDPSIIPSQEIIKYRVYRGITPTFDPGAGQGVKVLFASAGVQPTSAGPGSPVTWKDSSVISAFPPGTCTQYYYRLQAVDRCYTSNNYNTSGDLNDSISALSPPIGTNAIPGMANDLATSQAVGASNLKADTTTSACPAAASLNCKVDLTWSKITSDTAGNAIGVDKYRITRYRKKQTDPGFVLDTTFNGTGVLDVNGFSQNTAGIIGYSDTSGVAVDTSDGRPWYYQYKVAGNDCRLGQSSNTADYPTPCSINPAIVQVGASNAAASGDTVAQAWIMNAGDTIGITPNPALNIDQVTYDVTAYPSGTPVQLFISTSPPSFLYTWSDRGDGQIYQVKITVHNTSNCNEVHIKYVQDQSPVPCAFANQALIAPSFSAGNPNNSLFETYTLTNAGTDPMQVTGKPIAVTWSIPVVATHPDMKLVAIQYTVATTTKVDATITSPPTAARFVPAGLPNVAVGGTMTIRLQWSYRKQDDAVTPPSVTGQPLSKICLDYAIISEPGITKHCNLVGQIAGTANPTSCD